MMHFHQIPARVVAEPDGDESFVEMSQTLAALSLFLTVGSFAAVSLLASFWFSRRSLLPYRPAQRFPLRITLVKFSMVGLLVKVARTIFGSPSFAVHR